MYRSKRKAFTITELVIVIAVIAILAAVLIPTFSNVVESANKSAAMSNCRMAVAEYISMVTLDDDPDNNDVSGMVFSNDGYYFVYMDQKLAELGQAGKSNNILNIASDSTTVDAGTLEGFDIQTSRSADAIQTVTFTVNGKSTTVDLNELKNTGRALYLYNFQSEDGSKYAGFFVINAADGGDDYVISGANYSLVAGYSKYSESGPIKIATDTPTIEQPLLITAQYTGIPVKAGEAVTSVNVTVTATYSDGSSKEVENFTASDIPSTAGKHNVTFGYTDGEVTLECQTEVYVASGLTATLKDEGQPLVLKHNGTVDIGDVYAVYDIAYDLGDTTQLAQSAEVTAVVSDTVGQKGSVTLTCGAFQLTIDNLTVVKVFDSIKAVYEGGEIEINGKLDAGKVLVYAIFSDGTTEPITEGYTLSSVDTSVAGEKTVTVTVTYGEDNPKTATFTVTVVEVTANTYYFYNANGWAKVYAYTWSENYVEVTPTAGDYVLMGTILGEEGAWTVEKSVKLFFDAEGGKNEYVFKGLNLTAGMQFKVAYINADGNPVYFNLNSTPNNEGKDYIDANSASHQLVGDKKNIQITSDGVYDFYFDTNNYKLYFATTENQPNTPNVAILSTEYSGVFPGTAMTEVDGKPGWWAVQTDSRATFVKFSDKDNSANETGDLTLDSANVYYNNGWTSEIAQTTYYFYNVGGWAEVYAYVWTGEGNVKVEHLNAFPGTAMTAVEGNAGWYSITVDNNASNVIFNNGKMEDGEKLQTGNLVLDPQTPWCTYGNWYGEQPQMNTYYFYNADGWENVYAYAWTDGTYYFGNGSGVKMFDCGDGWYSVAVDANAVNINFNNGTISSANDLKLNAETPYYFGVWKAHKPTGIEAVYEGETLTVEHNGNGTLTVAEGLSVTLKYDNGDSEQVEGFTVTADTSKVGLADMAVSYTLGKMIFTCTVQDKVNVVAVLESIEATFTPQGVVFVNTEITASDFKVTKVMSNGDSETVSDTENVSVALKAGSTNAVEGKAIYVVTYQDKTAEVEVTFTRELTGITAVAKETTVEYEGTLELTVTANYDGAESATVTDYTTKFANTATGLQKVTVEYTENGITQTTTVQVVVNGVGQKTYFFKNTQDWSDVYAYAWSEEAPAAGDYIIVGINGNWDTGLKMSKMEDVATGYRYVKWTINEAVTFKVRLYQGDVWSAGVGIAESGISYTVADGGNITLQPGTYTIDFYTDSKNINISRYDETDGAQTSVNIYTSDWPGTAMKKMPGYEGWYYITIDANAQKIIFNNNAGDQTSNLDLNSDYVYYNGTEWVTSILA